MAEVEPSYNVYRQFRDHGAEWEDRSQARTLPTYPYSKRIIGKFLHDPTDRIQGYGIVKFPLRQRVVWRLSDDEKVNDFAP